MLGRLIAQAGGEVDAALAAESMQSLELCFGPAALSQLPAFFSAGPGMSSPA